MSKTREKNTLEPNSPLYFSFEILKVGKSVLSAFMSKSLPTTIIATTNDAIFNISVSNIVQGKPIGKSIIEFTGGVAAGTVCTVSGGFLSGPIASTVCGIAGSELSGQLYDIIAQQNNNQTDTLASSYYLRNGPTFNETLSRYKVLDTLQDGDYAYINLPSGRAQLYTKANGQLQEVNIPPPDSILLPQLKFDNATFQIKSNRSDIPDIQIDSFPSRNSNSQNYDVKITKHNTGEPERFIYSEQTKEDFANLYKIPLDKISEQSNPIVTLDKNVYRINPEIMLFEHILDKPTFVIAPNPQLVQTVSQHVEVYESKESYEYKESSEEKTPFREKAVKQRGEQSLEELQLISSLCDKIKAGVSLDEEVCNQGVAIAQKYFDIQHHTSLDDASKYNYEFVTETGEVGQLSNKMLLNNCRLHGIKDGNTKCYYSKILLAGYNIEATRTGVEITPEVSDKMRIKAFTDMGLNEQADLRALVGTVGGNTKINYSSVNDVIDAVKPHIGFATMADNISVMLPKKESAQQQVQTLSALASFKDSVRDFYNPSTPSSTNSTSFVCDSAKSLASYLSIETGSISKKYAGNVAASILDKNDVAASNIFSVETTHDRDLYTISESIGSRVMGAPEFVTRMVSSPISFVKPTPPPPPSSSVLMRPLPKIDNTRLKVEVSPDIHEKHEKQSSKELNSIWKEGIAAYGGHHEVLMPPSILNGDGATNVRPSSIVTGGWRPGAAEMSTFSTDNLLHDIVRSQIEKTSPPTMSQLVRQGAEFNRCRIGAFDELNIDPLVIDISGKGIKLTHWEKNEVLFDIDGDGFLEETGWVTGNTGLLVVDQGGKVNSVHQLLSEKFQGKEYEDGFAALKSLDENGDGVIDKADSIFNHLKVWLDISADGVCREGELKSLAELRIAKIVLNSFGPGGFSIEGNLVKKTAKVIMEDGSSRDIAAIDFIANSSGHKYEIIDEGVRILSKKDNVKIVENEQFQKIKYDNIERTTSTFFANTQSSEKLESDVLGVDNIYAGKGGVALIGGKGDNWLIGAKGRNQYFGVSGDNTIVINEDDLQTDIQGGTGFNTVLIESESGRYFNLQDSQIAVLYGSNHGDVLDSRTALYNCFIQAKGGNNIIYGSRYATSSLAGGSGDDIIISGEAGGILRANSGNNFLMSKGGNTLFESGNGFNYLVGGTGNNVFKCNAKGFSVCDGSSGNFNVLQLPGNIYDYSMEYNSDNHVVVRNKNYFNEFSAVLINVHKVNFAGMRNFDFNCVLPQKWLMPIKFDGLREIDVSELMQYEFSPLNKKVGFRGIHETKGCILTDHSGKNLLEMEQSELFQLTKLYLTYEEDYTGPVYIKYTPGTISHAVRFVFNKNGISVEDDGSSILVLRGQIEDIEQYYCDNLRIPTLKREGCLGQGIKIQVCEVNSDHADGVSYIIRQMLPRAKIFFTDKFFTYAHEQMDVLNFSVSFHSPLNTNMEYHYALGRTSSMLEKKERDILINAREGKGLPTVFSSGNERENGGDANYDLIKSMPEVIVVGAVVRDNIVGLGEAAVKPFSNPGANILVSAPGAFMPIVNRGVQDAFGNYFKGTHVLLKGTSYAAPLVSAVIAAMLQVNKHLTVNDIKKILACSAKIVEDGSEWEFNGAQTWNGGGMHFSYDFGFGNIDAHNAILLAKNWFVGERSFNKNTVVFSKDYLEVNKIANFSTSLSLEGEIISTSVNFLVGEVDIFNLSLDIVQDNKTYSVLKPKSGSELSCPTLKYSALTPLTYCMLGTNIKDTLGLKFKSLENSIKFGLISVQIVSVQDENTNYIFTDEYERLYNVERSVLEALNTSNTINLAPVTSVTDVNLNEFSMYLSDKHYTLKGMFQNVICSEARSSVVGNKENNVIVANGLYSDIYLTSGHNIVSSSSIPESTTRIISGEHADMFVIKKAANSVTIIEGFKQKKFDKTSGEQVYSDIINLGAFSEYSSPRELNIDHDRGSRIINLPDNQKVIIKDITTVFSNNFRFSKSFNIASQFGEKVNCTEIFTNLIFGFNENQIDETNLTELVGSAPVESSTFDSFC